jgi:catechol 2,3-dioxygenase-like lactoylglutathione lyase family enzyme
MTQTLPMVAEAPVTFHLSLNVTDLGRSVDFYRVLFGREPAKRHDDYAKFELDDPPVIFSLVPRAPGPGASLSHLGLSVGSSDEVRLAGERLAAGGICTQEQNGTVCGYARQDKVWAKDPDGNFWELYVVEEDVEPALVRRSLEGPAARLEPADGPVVWEHFLTGHGDGRSPHGDDSVDEARLTGTFNAPLDEAERNCIVAEAFRVLKPGSKVVTHALMADRAFVGPPPKLPGLAAMVARVPPREEAVAALRAAGFVGVQVVKLTEKPWFVHHGVGLREVKFAAWKPVPGACDATRQLLYKGPFGEATVDGGWVCPRGRRLTVPAAVWNQLRLGPSAEQFLFFEPGNETCSG